MGDVTLLARLTAFQRDERGKTLRLAPFVGLEMPTGADDAGDDLGRLPPPLQPGSGSWDLRLGAVLTRQTLERQIDTSLAYHLSTEANDFDFGDEARLDFSYQHRIHPRRLGGGVPAFLYAALESNLLWQDRHQVVGVDDPDSGAARLGTWLRGSSTSGDASSWRGPCSSR